MKIRILILLVCLFLPGCILIMLNRRDDDDYTYEYENIITTEPVNLESLNTRFDDYNSDLPYAYGGERLYFSSNRDSYGSNFDIIFRRLELSYHSRDNVFDIRVSNDYGSSFNNKLFALINTGKDELGPFSYEGPDSWNYFFYAGNESGNFDIKMVYTPRGDWGTYNGQQRLYGPMDATALNSTSDDLYPCIDTRRSRLFFCSNREGGFDIYSTGVGTFMNFHEFVTGNPVPVNKVIGLSGPGDDKCPSVRDDLLVFASDRAGGFGGFDLYYSIFKYGQWGEPVNFGGTINTDANEYRPVTGWFSNRRYMIFSTDRPGGKGGYDLYCADISAIVNPSLN